MTVRWTEGQGRADIEIQGHKLSLKAGEWSDWVPLTLQGQRAHPRRTG